MLGVPDSVTLVAVIPFGYPVARIGLGKKNRKPLAEVEKGLLAEIEKLKTAPVPAEELQKVKNNVAAASFRHLSSNFFVLLQLIVYDGYGDWREMNEAPKKAAAVTAEAVQRVARIYLTKENRAVYLITRKVSATAAPAKVTR
jgi:predicted Zn-dependent peptidase